MKILYHRVTNLSQEQRVRSDEIVSLKHVIRPNAYPTGFINFVINRSRRSDRLKKKVQPLGFRSIPYTR